MRTPHLFGRRRGSLLTAAALTATSLAALGAAPGAAVAAPRAASNTAPAVRLSIAHTRVEHGTRLSLTVNSARLQRGTALVLQRDFGTRHVFKTIQKLTGTHGTYSTAGVGQGRYRYRVVAVRSTKAVAVSNLRTVYSYAPVSATQLCNADNQTEFNEGCNAATVQVGSRVFEYQVYDGNGSTAPQQYAGVAATRSSCRSANLSLAVSNDDTSTTYGVDMLQSSADAQSVTGQHGSIATAAFPISSGSWNLDFWSDNGSDVYWNGTFDCWSPSGLA